MEFSQKEDGQDKKKQKNMVSVSVYRLIIPALEPTSGS